MKEKIINAVKFNLKYDSIPAKTIRKWFKDCEKIIKDNPTYGELEHPKEINEKLFKS